MAESITFNNATYIIPDVGESNWGQNLTNYFVAIPSGCYQLSGGTAPLTADLSFGSNYGLFAKYLTSVTSTPATAGVVRLAKTDAIEWRNNANGANLALAIDTSNNLLWNGDIVATASASPVLSLAGTTNEITASAATGNITLSLPATLIAPGSIAATTTLAGTTATLSATTNQILLGTTNVITISSTAPASSQTYTIPDAGGAANVVLDKGNYTIAGTWGFNNAVTIGASTNQIVLGTTRTLTITSPEPASSSRVLTLPDPGGNDSVVYLALAQTLTNKTLTSPVINTGISGSAVFPIANGGTNSSTALNSNCIMVSSSGKIVELATSTSGYILQCNGSSAPSWVSNTPTFSGLTQYGAMYASTTTALASTAAGTANYALLANTGSAPTFQAIPNSIAGTSNQIAASASTGSVTLSLASPMTTPGAVTVTGNLGFAATTDGISGATDASNAGAGLVGEVKTAINTANSGTAATPANITTIALTAGRWMVSACLTQNGGTAAQCYAWVSIYSGSTSTDAVTGENTCYPPSSSILALSFTFPNLYYSFSTTTTLYLKAAVGSGSAVSTTGFISAVRIA